MSAKTEARESLYQTLHMHGLVHLTRLADAYAAAAAAEAREPLVGALQPLANVSRFTDFSFLPSEEEWAAWANLILGAAALAKETP